MRKSSFSILGSLSVLLVLVCAATASQACCYWAYQPREPKGIKHL